MAIPPELVDDEIVVDRTVGRRSPLKFRFGQAAPLCQCDLPKHMTARDCDSWEVVYDIPYSVQSNSSYSRISLWLRVDIHVLIWLWVMTLLAERQWCVTVWGMVSTSYYFQPMVAFVAIAARITVNLNVFGLRPMRP
ncbi:uncharacterized protein BO96DRAFT_436815 [Aspergillus niger CBS 101883]|uniref:Uncharacterized protein n=2 Tax=Aspergillus niger TaxID=5061 RepID=A2QY59_ASPNC|nr:uncharacterized protein BO96DRAFT_436815 [Aspergillus niger CBS 101883]XP_059601729.1 hypothetical protein An12g00090 [Aspergillus niger]PYH53517.1 hypothetical protein BO96DRAFT_436815 [Aspergillus niger CBS 101883]CAK40939.1 hypothetical protein An12g00090 [Aspergillus niger]